MRALAQTALSIVVAGCVAGCQDRETPAESDGTDTNSTASSGGTTDSDPSGGATDASSGTASASGGPATVGSTGPATVGSTGPATDTGSSSGGVELENFSFFTTSLAGLQELSGREMGFGGNLTYEGAVGVDGADKICETLAEMSMPGSAVKRWRAFLSTSTGDAVDRVGQGPWYDRNGRLFAEDLNGLLSERPDGDPALANDLPNEWGIPNSTPEGQSLDNHDTMTASGADGRLLLQGQGGGSRGGDFSTCQDFTSAAPGQDPPAMGHSWPARSGTSWIYVGRHGTGCEALVWLEQTGSDCEDASGVGCGGGYGGFYCFALTP